MIALYKRPPVVTVSQRLANRTRLVVAVRRADALLKATR